MKAEKLSDGLALSPDRERFAAMLKGQAPTKRRPVPVCPPEKRRRRGDPALNDEQARASRELAERIGAVRAAAHFNVSTGTMYRTWSRAGLPTLTGRKHRQRVFTASRSGRSTGVDYMARYLAEHGPDATAAHFGCGRSTIYRALERYNITPPIGKGAPGRPRKTA